LIKKFLFKKRKIPFLKKGFTLVELIVVISIIAILTGIVVLNVSVIMEKSKVSAAGATQRALTKAVLMYYADMGFYPPDVNRGWDPGLVKKDVWNPDGLASGNYSTSNANNTANTARLPLNWQNIVDTRWNGPYLASWPLKTPWGGVYDYNYWTDENTDRGGCGVPKGIYMGVEKYYNDSDGAIPNSVEQKMLDYGFDINCITNNEAQMILMAL
jgi:general secretion pathway protein G